MSKEDCKNFRGGKILNSLKLQVSSKTQKIFVIIKRKALYYLLTEYAFVL